MKFLKNNIRNTVLNYIGSFTICAFILFELIFFVALKKGTSLNKIWGFFLNPSTLIAYIVGTITMAVIMFVLFYLLLRGERGKVLPSFLYCQAFIGFFLLGLFFEEFLKY